MMVSPTVMVASASAPTVVMTSATVMTPTMAAAMTVAAFYLNN
jgi:hypothetical protein